MTWRFFEEGVTAGDNWLVPDNYQENRADRIAHRTSPTNVGLQMMATVSAWDLGYLSARECLTRLGRTVDTLNTLPRYRGHFFNWFDTQSLVPLPPLYVSTVDSGNFLAYLMTLCTTLPSIAEGELLIDRRVQEGLLDTLDLLERGGAGFVSFNMNEEDIERIMKRPYTMTCTDGDLVPMGEGKPHPRAYGAFPRKLRLYVKERGIVDLPFAIRSMTSLPAQVFALKDRGQLRPGAFADVLIFDPLKVTDAATYTEPHQLAEGVSTIFVNGELVRDNGRFTPALPGRVLVPERR